MTESVFRKRLLQLWLSFTIVGLLASRILTITVLKIESQKIVFLSTWLAAMLLAAALYFKGSNTTHSERERILGEAHVKSAGWVVVFCSTFMLLMMQASLALVIWVTRTANSWTDLALIPVRLMLILGITTTVFEIVRNAHLRRIQERDISAG